MVQDCYKSDKIKTVKACKGNLFDCELFSLELATLIKAPIIICDVNGSIGAAKASLKTWYYYLQ